MRRNTRSRTEHPGEVDRTEAGDTRHQAAKAGRPVSKLLNSKIMLDAPFVN
jgi:hypothetical protein